MHSPLISLLSLGLAVPIALGNTPDVSLLAGIVLSGVLVIGLPHGGLDHRVGARLFADRGVRQPLIRFVMVYLLASMAVIVGWYVAPLVTIVSFFLLSAWHFGLEEDPRRNLSPLGFVGMLARGGMIIWLPSLAQEAAVLELLNWTVPSASSWMLSEGLQGLNQLAPLLIGLTVYDLATFTPDERLVADRWHPDGQHVLRCLSLAVLFCVAHPLVSFAVYFCGWHSPRGLAELYREFGPRPGAFAMALLPISLVAIVLFAIGIVIWSQQISLTESAVRTTFIGLSAVAIPHLALHIAATAQRRRRNSSPRWKWEGAS